MLVKVYDRNGMVEWGDDAGRRYHWRVGSYVVTILSEPAEAALRNIAGSIPIAPSGDLNPIEMDAAFAIDDWKRTQSGDPA